VPTGTVLPAIGSNSYLVVGSRRVEGSFGPGEGARSHRSRNRFAPWNPGWLFDAGACAASTTLANIEASGITELRQVAPRRQQGALRRHSSIRQKRVEAAYGIEVGVDRTRGLVAGAKVSAEGLRVGRHVGPCGILLRAGRCLFHRPDLL
jgi:hypothetical protein